VADHFILLEAGRVRLSSPIREVARHFVKLRRPDKVDHPVFHHPACLQLGVNADGSRRYLIEEAEARALRLPDSIVDAAGVTADEAFIYFTQRSGS
jgi:hypothetical protein